MKLKTSRFGETEVNEDLIFTFIEPILGYDHLKQFVLIDNNPESPFKWLQSVEDPNIAFPISFPSYFGINYEFVIPEEKSQKLEMKGIENVVTFNIVCIPQGKAEESTINLAGPLVINAENKKGMQLILANTKYSVKHRLFSKNTEQKKEEPKRKEDESQ